MQKTENVKPVSNSNNLLKTIFYVLLALVLFVIIFSAGALSFWFYQTKITPKAEASPSPTVIVLPSVIPSPQESLIPLSSLEPSTTPQATSDLQLLKEAFAKKYNHPSSEANVAIDKQDGPYISGGITFSGEMGGGWFLAYKQGGSWIIVADGNGVVECDKIEPYNFPTDMVPECWDEAQSKLITR